jgi:hypothetical protein
VSPLTKISPTPSPRPTPQGPLVQNGEGYDGGNQALSMVEYFSAGAGRVNFLQVAETGYTKVFDVRSTNPRIVTVTAGPTVDGSARIFLTAVSRGDADIVVSDIYGQKVKAQISVGAHFEVKPEQIRLAVNSSKTFLASELWYGSYGPGFFVGTSSNASVATVTLGSGYDFGTQGAAATFTVTGVVRGSAMISVKDLWGQVLTLPVTVR